MSGPVLIQIIGAPIACKEGVKDTWREVAGWAEGQLKARFGDAVQVKYYDLFDARLPAHARGCAAAAGIWRRAQWSAAAERYPFPPCGVRVEARLSVEHA